LHCVQKFQPFLIGAVLVPREDPRRIRGSFLALLHIRLSRMNYRHAFHAGNFADVFKHTVLIGLLDALKQKAAPFCYFDTHAGAGSYDLHGLEAGKTAEAADGVLRLLDLKSPPPLLQGYLDLLRSLNPAGMGRELALYPGSPLIAARLMRDSDRAVLCELQPDEAARLKKLFAHDARVGVHQRDGYAALGALVPPKERRGLVLIDPPFEAQDDEFRAIEAALATAYSRWPTGIYAICTRSSCANRRGRSIAGSRRTRSARRSSSNCC